MPNLIYVALGFFFLAIVFGLILFIQVLCNRPSFKPAVFFHGLGALVGLICLGVYAVQHVGAKPWLSLTVLILAALGGLTMLSFDLRKKPIPRAILLLHPLAALIGLGLLVYYLIKG